MLSFSVAVIGSLRCRQVVGSTGVRGLRRLALGMFRQCQIRNGGEVYHPFMKEVKLPVMADVWPAGEKFDRRSQSKGVALGL